MLYNAQQAFTARIWHVGWIQAVQLLCAKSNLYALKAASLIAQACHSVFSCCCKTVFYDLLSLSDVAVVHGLLTEAWTRQAQAAISSYRCVVQICMHGQHSGKWSMPVLIMIVSNSCSNPDACRKMP